VQSAHVYSACFLTPFRLLLRSQNEMPKVFVLDPFDMSHDVSMHVDNAHLQPIYYEQLAHYIFDDTPWVSADAQRQDVSHE